MREPNRPFQATVKRDRSETEAATANALRVAFPVTQSSFSPQIAELLMLLTQNGPE